MAEADAEHLPVVGANASDDAARIALYRVRAEAGEDPTDAAHSDASGNATGDDCRDRR